MQARNPAFTEATQKQVRELAELGWYHSIELPDGEVIPGLQSIGQLQSRIARFPLPADLTGKRVLDIGAWDGWFSFEMERRGAEVVAVDSFKQERFLLARELLQSRVEYRIEDICRLTPQKIGYFDYVLFFGVLYHVKHPILALENVCRLTRETAFVESYVTDDGSDLAAPPLMEFYETTELRGQFDNWVGPNTACLLGFCRTAGFARVTLETVVNNRAHVTCNRKWPETACGAGRVSIVAVENSVTRDQTFSTEADEYLSIWFKSDESGLGCDDVYPVIGPFGTRPVHVSSSGPGGWMANCKLPLGLEDGQHAVRLLTAGGTSTNAAPIWLGESVHLRPHITRAPRIEVVADGVTWERNQVRVGAHGGVVSIWVADLPGEVSREHVAVRCGDQRCAVSFCSLVQPDGLRQINASLPASLLPGNHFVSVSAGKFESEPAPVNVIGD